MDYILDLFAHFLSFSAPLIFFIHLYQSSLFREVKINVNFIIILKYNKPYKPAKNRRKPVCEMASVWFVVIGEPSGETRLTTAH